MHDVIVIGSGPAGATAAMYLGQAGKKVLVVDKAGFPRDKICGDAQGRKAANIMRELGIEEGYRALPGHPIYGITLSSPNGTTAHVDITGRDKPSPGFCHRREVFDEYLHVDDAKEATIIPNIIVGQLLAYYLTLEKGLDPDMPRNLAKSVTVK